MMKNLKLKNVRLETGFKYENGEIRQTQTELFTVEIRDGKIEAIRPNNTSAEAKDANGLLMLPAFKDMHTHLDKTLFGLPWQAHLKKNQTVEDMIAYEQEIIPELLETSVSRSEQLIEYIQSKGTGFARSHVNIDSTSELESLNHLLEALDAKEDSFDTERVAFPQHGVFYTPSANWMERAAKTEAIDYIGGLDPYSIDGSIERSMDFTVQLALDHDKGIDIHLHETEASGLQTVQYLIDKVNENPVLKGRTFISHCYVLGNILTKNVHEVAEKLADAEIGIITALPFADFKMPLPILFEHGIDVRAGTDNIQDHWGTFGSGSMLRKANLAAQLYRYETEFELSRMLKLATHNVLPLDDDGTRQWPKEGDKADTVLVDASCSAEAVSRVSPVKSLIHDGKIVF